MIYKIILQRYRKFKTQEIEFCPTVNLISGTNGTCKSSLLHIISNSFQAVQRTTPWLTNKNFPKFFSSVNQQVNPKVNNLARGDKVYNDPALGHKGSFFGVTYFGRNQNEIVEFRRHNTTLNTDSPRYYIKPQYKKGDTKALPFCPVVYLGLSRLLAFGEFEHENDLKTSKIGFPLEYLDEAKNLYKKFTNIEIKDIETQKMGSIKTRFEFVSDKQGIDSNTISSGEDNLSIIINSLLSLKYYAECIDNQAYFAHSNTDVKSVLLIDELDATLHPSVQDKLLNTLAEFSQAYGIQVFATTHSLSLLEYALKHKHRVLYLINNVDSVEPMNLPDINKIKLHLNSQNQSEIYEGKAIPIYSEDAEARELIKLLFSYKADKDREADNIVNGFNNVARLFHLVEVNLGANNLKDIFDDKYLKSSTIQAVCILDGDKNSDKNLSNRILVLPGNNNPEEMLKHYSLELFNATNSEFWRMSSIVDRGYSKQYFSERVKPDLDNISISESSGLPNRSENKKFFNTHKDFLLLVFGYWLKQDCNQSQIESFFSDLWKIYHVVAPLHGFSQNEWPKSNVGD